MQSVRPDGDGVGVYALAHVDLEFSDLGRRLALCRFPSDAAVSTPETVVPEPARWRRLESGAGGVDPLVRMLLRADSRRLRELLAREEYSVHRFDDHRVRVAVAQLILRGVLRMFEQTIAPSGAPVVTVPVVLEAVSLTRYALAPAAAVAPPGVPALSGVRPEPAAVATPVAAPPNPVQALDQDAQAAALIAAARNGIPFCEECARAAAARRAVALETA